ncbi:MAG TPA: aspartate--tRNA(Asn) ligase [Candidatus Pacearchaeota archaeon]|jgi:nondiscriminating aspartyl-tRNA synthetase|nr:aspartate--tRNA(Asn) ligase [Candidatus Pacearchaeota archaeon]
MQNRILIKDLKNYIGQEVIIAGTIDLRRDHGKLIFLDLRDRSGFAQIVVNKKNESVYNILEKVKSEWNISLKGLVKKRTEQTINPNVFNGDLEVEALTAEILGEAEEIPFEKDTTEINLETYLDYLPYTLRGEKPKAIFRIQSQIVKLFREFLTQQDFVEIQAPKIIGEDAEGGATTFVLDYFGYPAHLAQSPQFYKQIMVGVYERVFTVGNVYRAEPHSTTRHLNEYTSLDLEMGFIENHVDIMDLETHLLAYIMQGLEKTNSADFKFLNATIPIVPDQIPVLKFREAQKLIKEATGEDCLNEPDLEPAHERWLCEYSSKKFNSDFIFITHFPMSKRPMYTYEDENDPGYAKGFDLLFRGIEVTTGGQRIHNYEKLVLAIKQKGLNPEKFNYYLQAFKYGMPPHGGLGMGLERLTAKLIGVDNVREAALFPRDIHRIDYLLSQGPKNNNHNNKK